jgi:hypothetical protein
MDFKTWLKKTKGGRVGIGEIEIALEKLDEIPLEFTNMINRLASDSL